MKMNKTRLFTLMYLVVFTLFAFKPTNIDANPSTTTWKEDLAPHYYLEIGKAKVTNKPKAGVIKYSKLDKYGRTGRAVGNITYKMVKESAGWRQPIPDGTNPSGWTKNQIVTIKLYNGNVYRGYFWNRSHLIADSLGGKAIKRNLITGTRMQNVGANNGKGGMAYMERKAVNWLYKHKKGTIYYSASPVYVGKELVPRSVIVDIKTSDGSINKRVVVYNAAKGYTINYAKGTFTVHNAVKTSTPNKPKVNTVYVTKSGAKYHLDKNCRGLRNAKSILSTTLNEAKVNGLEPCSLCGK